MQNMLPLCWNSKIIWVIFYTFETHVFGVGMDWGQQGNISWWKCPYVLILTLSLVGRFSVIEAQLLVHTVPWAQSRKPLCNFKMVAPWIESIQQSGISIALGGVIPGKYDYVDTITRQHKIINHHTSVPQQLPCAFLTFLFCGKCDHIPIVCRYHTTRQHMLMRHTSESFSQQNTQLCLQNIVAHRYVLRRYTNESFSQLLSLQPHFCSK